MTPARLAGAMNPKVLRLMALVDEGFAIHGVQPSRDGGLRLTVKQKDQEEDFDFEFYEVPAIHGATKVVGLAA